MTQTIGSLPCDRRWIALLPVVLLPVKLLPVKLLLVLSLTTATAYAQSVCLPAPRLLTVMPMGGQAGSEVDVTITGESLDGAEQLIFSNPLITATPKLNADGTVLANQFAVHISDACPAGVYDARVMAGLGISSARAFSVSDRPELTQSAANNSLASAMEIEVGSIVNATLADRSVSYFAFTAAEGQRIIVDCVAKGIDSKMNPVVIVADATGSDLIVERRGGVVDFRAPVDGRYVVKVHDLTFKGGPYYFYRLALTEIPVNLQPPRLPAVRSVASYSWPPVGLDEFAAVSEAELSKAGDDPMNITLPCDVLGSFFPAADVDTYQFEAKKGELWWVEVASERLGLLTDPSVVVQRVVEGSDPVDVAELADIPSPVKRSSNGYSYDGPPYNAGSSDVLGKFEIPEDGVYQIRITDLFGGTRNDPANEYRMIVRKASPDFSIVGWALHMELRNGDRNALSKPIALRGGAVIPIEVVAMRRDDFDGDIELSLDNLPEGVTATGLTIAAGTTRGILLISADSNAPRGLEMARFVGRATMDGHEIERQGHLASMKWPVPNANSEIPDPRLVDQFPVSVGGIEPTPLSIETTQPLVCEVSAGKTLTIPLAVTRHGEFSGKTMSLRTWGTGFERAPALELSLTEDQTQVVLDTAKLNPPPGDYTIAFYGGAVAKYGYRDEKPKDIVDIYVSKPISIRVNAAEAKAK